MMDERDKTAAELEIIKNKSIVVMWEEELNALETEYIKYRDDRIRSVSDAPKLKKKFNITKSTK